MRIGGGWKNSRLCLMVGFCVNGSTLLVTFKQTRESALLYLLQPIIYCISIIDLTSKYL